MLRFVRKIEQNFLQLSGFYKFLIYGATEITLLVIGIIIALQVNTWSQQRNDGDLERYYVKALHEEVQKDIADIQRVIAHDEGVLDSINRLLTVVKEDESIDAPDLMPYWGSLFTTQGINPNTIIFEDMKSSGRLSLLSSTELRFQIQEYYNYIIEAQDDAQSNTELIYRWFNDYFIGNGADINSLYASISPTIVEVTPYRPKVFTAGNPEDIADRLSVRYGLTELNQVRYNNSLELAKTLKEHLAIHLEEID